MMKTNAKRKNSAVKKLIPAAGMLALSASMLATSTYAWFTMNTTVTVKNMAVKAKAEGGLLISEVNATNSVWDDEANTTAELAAAKVALYPTSTANGVTWYHATSKAANDAAAATSDNGTVSASANKGSGYNALTLAAHTLQAAASDANGKKEVYFADTNTATNGYDDKDSMYYLKYTYYLKTSSEGVTTLGLGANAQNVEITEVSVSRGDGVSAQELDKALRVGVAIGGKFYIFTPVAGATGTYYVNAGSTATTPTNSSNSGTTAIAVPTALGSLNGITGEGAEVNIYMWYEGEDAACKSDNIASSLNELTVQVKFSLATLGTAADDSGVSMGS